MWFLDVRGSWWCSGMKMDATMYMKVGEWVFKKMSWSFKKLWCLNKWGRWAIMWGMKAPLWKWGHQNIRFRDATTNGFWGGGFFSKSRSWSFIKWTHKFLRMWKAAHIWKEWMHHQNIKEASTPLWKERKDFPFFNLHHASY